MEIFPYNLPYDLTSNVHLISQLGGIPPFFRRIPRILPLGLKGLDRRAEGKAWPLLCGKRPGIARWCMLRHRLRSANA
jgi:hypothetical protein